MLLSPLPSPLPTPSQARPNSPPLSIHHPTPTPLRLNDVVQSEGRLYLVFEFVDKDLKKYFEASDGPLSWQLIKSYTYQVSGGGCGGLV